MASVRVCACVRACAIEIKPGMLRAACFDDVRVWMRIRFALQDVNFHRKKGLFSTVYKARLFILFGKVHFTKVKGTSANLNSPLHMCLCISLSNWEN